jgi:hypothetical protein
VNSNDDAIVVRKNEPRRLVVFLMQSPSFFDFKIGRFYQKIAIVNSNDDAVVVRKNEPRRLVVFLMKSPHHNSYAGLPTSKHQPWLPVHSRARVHCMPTNGVAWKNRLVFQCLRPSVYTMTKIVKLCPETTRKSVKILIKYIELMKNYAVLVSNFPADAY